MPSAAPPKPRPWPAESVPADFGRLTAPEAWHLYSGVIGYHLPQHLNNAARLSQGLALVK